MTTRRSPGSSAAMSWSSRRRLALVRDDAVASMKSSMRTPSRRAYSRTARRFALRTIQAAMAHRDTSVSELCRELGITPVTLYRYLITHKAQVGAAAFPGARASSPRAVHAGWKPALPGGPRSHEGGDPGNPVLPT